ncbi:Von Willebrand factor type A domain-containing protein [Spironucleus salmonicida]|uniref:von Willebrand factor type A domain-containing protein n=1 Tax=Spironucleus salmonicida TaxID=348837 RepID=V6LBJ9_9EUKA|nr:Von Willebrand factor type A domain-containing protein [Spironucleus salmonicida]|eukprot:EST41792.1 Von Willebrand factor type A domain-containing protein [Spironucleus salmonicida]
MLQSQRQIYIDLGSSNTKVIIKTKSLICNPWLQTKTFDDSVISSDLYCDMNNSAVDQINADYSYLLLNNKKTHHHSYKQDNIIVFKNILKALFASTDDMIQFPNLPLIVCPTNKRNYPFYYVLLAYFRVLSKEIKRYFINVLKVKDYNYQNTQIYLIQNQNCSEKQKAAILKVFNFAFGSQVDELKVSMKEQEKGLVYYLFALEKLEAKNGTKISIIDCKNQQFYHTIIDIGNTISVGNPEKIEVKNGVPSVKISKITMAIGGNTAVFKNSKDVKIAKYGKVFCCLGYCQDDINDIKIQGTQSAHFFGVETLVQFDSKIDIRNIELTFLEQNGKTFVVNACKILIKPGDYFADNAEDFVINYIAALPSHQKDDFVDIVIHQFEAAEIEEYGEFHVYKGSSDPIGGFHLSLDQLDKELPREKRSYEVCLRLTPNLQGVVKRVRYGTVSKTVKNLELDCFTPLKFQFKSKRHTVFVVDASGSMNSCMKNLYEPVNFKNEWRNLFGAVIDRIILYLRNRQNYVDDIFSLIIFNSEATILLDKVQNIQLIFQKINNIQVAGQSDILSGIIACSKVQYKGDMKALSYEQICIVFTDGDVKYDSEKSEIVYKQLEEDMDLHVVAFGDTDYTALNQMCDTMHGEFHLSKDLDDLQSVFYFVATE